MLGTRLESYGPSNHWKVLGCTSRESEGVTDTTQLLKYPHYTLRYSLGCAVGGNSPLSRR